MKNKYESINRKIPANEPAVRFSVLYFRWQYGKFVISFNIFHMWWSIPSCARFFWEGHHLFSFSVWTLNFDAIFINFATEDSEITFIPSMYELWSSQWFSFFLFKWKGQNKFSDLRIPRLASIHIHLKWPFKYFTSNRPSAHSSASSLFHMAFVSIWLAMVYRDMKCG